MLTNAGPDPDRTRQDQPGHGGGRRRCDGCALQLPRDELAQQPARQHVAACRLQARRTRGLPDVEPAALSSRRISPAPRRVRLRRAELAPDGSGTVVPDDRLRRDRGPLRRWTRSRWSSHCGSIFRTCAGCRSIQGISRRPSSQASAAEPPIGRNERRPAVHDVHERHDGPAQGRRDVAPRRTSRGSRACWQPPTCASASAPSSSRRCSTSPGWAWPCRPCTAA